MPCFLVGKNTAGLLGQAWKAPVEHFSHQQGHIAAALYSAGRLELLERRFLAFHVSGGTTEALLVQPDGEGMPHITLAAHSLDLKAGQAVDRVGLLLGALLPPAGRSWSGWPSSGRGSSPTSRCSRGTIAPSPALRTSARPWWTGASPRRKSPATA